MENLGCKGTAGPRRLQPAPWNGSGSCLRGGFACIACTEPGFESPGHAFQETPKLAGIPIGFADRHAQGLVCRAGRALQIGDAKRVRNNAVEDHPVVLPPCARRGRQVTRIVLGPFNRVEGDLELSLDLAAGRVQVAYVNSPLFRGF